MATDWLDEIEAQADDTVPYYLPRLIREIRTQRDEIARLSTALAAQPATPLASPEPPLITGDTSDGYHTFNELYAYRKAYHALVENEWARQGRYDVHKSWRHADGEPCFGGGWFIVVAETPAGQVSNHYKADDWPLFQCPERERGNPWDGHTPQVALDRLLALAASPVPVAPQETKEE